MPRSILFFAFFVSCSIFAQTGNRITEAPNAPPSRWQQEREVLDQALRSRVLVATDPRDLWIAGQLDTVDPWAQAASLAQARIRAQSERLYLASLAMACTQSLRPLPVDCDATDRLADWSIRDADNGVPVLMLAERERRRNNPDAMLAFLQEAGARTRFDDYHDRGTFLIWEALRALPGNTDPAAGDGLAASYGARASFAVQQIDALCREAQKAADNIRQACSAAGSATARNAATWPLRIAGARLAERTAAQGAAQDTAKTQLAGVLARAFDCTDAVSRLNEALESPDAGVRARAVAQWEARLARQAQVGEVAACDTKG